MVLESEGHTVHTAADGPSGLYTILRVRPDVALVDVGLPGLDGYRLAERLRSAGLRTYLIALTGYGRREDKKRARDAGFDAHVTKPPPMDYLLQARLRRFREIGNENQGQTTISGFRNGEIVVCP